MNEEVFQKLINIYSELETKLLNEIVKHFNYNDEFINSDYWRFEKLKELGLLNENIVKYIAEVTDKTPAEIKKAIQQLGNQSINMNNLNEAYRGGLIEIDPNILIENQVVDNLIKFSYNELTNRFIEISSKIENATREAYLNVVEKAYIQATNGITYQHAIRNALLDLGERGISTLTYKTVDDEGNIKGLRHYDIEGTVRRELVTASHNLTSKINQSIAEELDVEYLYLSEHIKCRPEHFPWQGTIIKRKDLVKVTRYGEVDGLGGPNCKHYPTPYFGKARGSELKHISLEEATEQYNLSQQQRYLERGIRKWKRKAEIFKKNDDVEQYALCQNKIKEWQLRNNKFVEDNKLKRDFIREDVYSIKSERMNKQYKELVKEANLKYNIGTREENIARCVKARRIQTDIKSDNTIKTIIEVKQNKHNIVNDNDSYFYITLADEQKLVNKYAGTGIIKFDRSGNWNNKELITIDKIIGKYINKNYNTVVDTNSFIIHYSQKGTHIVPANKREVE